ncbi:MAG: hypothetical protein GVY19_00370 [Bacteroidetes bacterium]|nr:hypothetical protein [Bacteroidota bacterium]
MKRTVGKCLFWKNTFFRLTFFTLITGFLIIQSSCVSKEKLEYFSIEEIDTEQEYKSTKAKKVIQPYDKLYIKVYSLDEQVNNLFTNERIGGNTDLNLISYTVSDSGYVDFPFVGKVMVAGMNIDQAKTKFENEINKYLPNSSVIVRFVGNTLTVVGEVTRPGEYPYYDDKVNIFQAIGFAGGVSQYGDKSEITIVREYDDKILYKKLDLTKANVVESDYYYLLPNDIIVVEPIKAKYRSYRDFALISLILSTISTLTLLLNYSI